MAYMLKVLVLGDGEVGKSSFIKRLCQNVYSEKHKKTVGLDFNLKQLSVDGNSIKLQLWDISANDRRGNNPIGRLFYKNALGCFLVYDLSKPESLNNIIKWIEEINSKVTLPSGKKLPILLVGNKSDLIDNTQVSVDENILEKICTENNLIGYVITSAANGDNVEKATVKLVREICRYDDAFIPKPRKVNDIDLTLADDIGEEGSCCY